jgi:hypothetical protein
MTVSGALFLMVSADTLRGQQLPPPPPLPEPSAPIIQQMLEQKRNSGSNVTPSFEGWEPNPDGTFTLYFGYLNRNWQEELDIPVGPNNFFAPGPQDRGQPEHFLTRRRKKYFGVVVPKDFGDKTLTWTLSIRGRTEKVPGSLKPILQIDVSKDTQTGNLPPTIELGPNQTIAQSQSAALTATYRDDGLPKPRPPRPDRAGAQRQVARPEIVWSKYRGPGTVTFSQTAIPVQGGKVETTATFSEPGVYQIQALGNDGSLTGNPTFPIPDNNCCWVTKLVTITVKPAS